MNECKPLPCARAKRAVFPWLIFVARSGGQGRGARPVEFFHVPQMAVANS